MEFTVLYILLLIPLMGMLLPVFKKKAILWLVIFLSGLSVALSIFVYATVLGNGELKMHLYRVLLPLGDPIRLTALVDSYSAAMLVAIQMVVLSVQIFSLEYLINEPRKYLYYTYLHFFAGAMNILVVADHLLLMFVFWELVGLASYLLIGFWYQKPAAATAAKKAFLINKVADSGFLVAIIALWGIYGVLEISGLPAIVMQFHTSLGYLHLIGACLVLAAMGKSAQLFFMVWLPDAMEGPTPASALIHAATMVAAGVFLLVKVSFLFTDEVLQALAYIGGITAFLAALFAFAQNDIKKLLAFSTVSQLGLMMCMVGIGQPDAAFFHLLTHAFFKAGLFLCAGSVIHALHHSFENRNITHLDAQDMRIMGGFRKTMPLTFAAYVVCAIALMGMPFTAGFLSKEYMLSSVWHYANENHSAIALLVLFVLTSVATVAYMSRQLWEVFIKPSALPPSIVPHENNLIMLIPVMALALGSTFAAFSWQPFSTDGLWWLPISGQAHADSSFIPYIITAAVFILGLGLFAAFIYKNAPFQKGFVYRLLHEQAYLNALYIRGVVMPTKYIAQQLYYFDELWLDKSIKLKAVIHVVWAHVIAFFDKRVVDGIIHLPGTVFMRLGKGYAYIQSGYIQRYMFYAFLLLTGLLVLMLFW